MEPVQGLNISELELEIPAKRHSETVAQI